MCSHSTLTSPQVPVRDPVSKHGETPPKVGLWPLHALSDAETQAHTHKSLEEQKMVSAWVSQ